MTTPEEMQHPTYENGDTLCYGKYKMIILDFVPKNTEYIKTKNGNKMIKEDIYNVYSKGGHYITVADIKKYNPALTRMVLTEKKL